MQDYRMIEVHADTHLAADSVEMISAVKVQLRERPRSARVIREAICGSPFRCGDGKIVNLAVRASKTERLNLGKPVKKRPEVAIAGAFETAETKKFRPHCV
ncbi:MAG: hypothetical protein H7070_07290 [Saprospiraceae bacterium]|nr:hypothetical protein [Pyrinomonadaceae bacterium]